MDRTGDERDRFQRDHDALRVIMGDFAVMMVDDGWCGRAELTRARLAFSRVFKVHLAEEEASVRRSLATSADAAARAIAADYLANLRDQSFRYSAHIRTWSPDAIEADWSGYCRAVLAMQADLRRRMEWEERALFPLLPPASALRDRAA